MIKEKLVRFMLWLGENHSTYKIGPYKVYFLYTWGAELKPRFTGQYWKGIMMSGAFSMLRLGIGVLIMKKISVMDMRLDIDAQIALGG